MPRSKFARVVMVGMAVVIAVFLAVAGPSIKLPLSRLSADGAPGSEASPAPTSTSAPVVVAPSAPVDVAPSAPVVVAPSSFRLSVGDDALSEAEAILPLDSGGTSNLATTLENATPAQEFSAADAFARAERAGVPNAKGNTIVLGVCAGGTGMSHWGYYNNGANGGAVPEPDGTVVPLGALCINPAQPDVYSTILHELGHRYFWEHGLWAFTGKRFGGTEQAAECFAEVFGATVFGEGGCSDADAQRMRVTFAW